MIAAISDRSRNCRIDPEIDPQSVEKRGFTIQKSSQIPSFSLFFDPEGVDPAGFRPKQRRIGSIRIAHNGSRFLASRCEFNC